jgi:adenylyltransferase/sulfurtransferase
MSSDVANYNLDVLGESVIKALSEIKVLIVGLGGLGSFVATELVRLGVKNLILVDNDKVSLSNLNRQILYKPSDVGKSKVLTAADRLKEISPDLNVEAFHTKLDRRSAPFLVGKADFVIDCTDNLETKRLLNLASFVDKKAFISAGVGSWDGWVASFPFFKEDLKDVPCLECLFPSNGDKERRLNLSGATIVPTVAVIGSLQVVELLKVLGDFGQNLQGSSLLVDLKTYKVITVRIPKRKDCPVCGVVR